MYYEVIHTCDSIYIIMHLYMYIPPCGYSTPQIPSDARPILQVMIPLVLQKQINSVIITMNSQSCKAIL